VWGGGRIGDTFKGNAIFKTYKNYFKIIKK
jgi:hypothetical protein